MNEPNETVDTLRSPRKRASAWWQVRPVLQVCLVAEVIALVALFNTDATSAALLRAWFRPLTYGFEQLGWADLQFAITVMAIAAVVAVIVEAVRTGRRAIRRNAGELKTASA